MPIGQSEQLPWGRCHRCWTTYYDFGCSWGEYTDSTERWIKVVVETLYNMKSLLCALSLQITAVHIEIVTTDFHYIKSNQFLVLMIIVTFVVMRACEGMRVHACVCGVTPSLSQEGKHGAISYLVCRCTTLSTRSLLFLVEVTWGQQGSNCENLVNMISQAGKLGRIQCSTVCRCSTWSASIVLFLVEVKGHLGSTWVKLWKPCIYLKKESLDRSHIWYVGVQQ